MKTLASLRICAGSPEPSLLGNSINILISCAYSFFLVMSVTDAIFKAKEVNRLLKLLSTGKGPFAKPDRRILEWELKKIDGIKDRTELDGGIVEHKLHIKPEEQNRILWVCQYITYNQFRVLAHSHYDYLYMSNGQIKTTKRPAHKRRLQSEPQSRRKTQIKK